MGLRTPITRRAVAAIVSAVVLSMMSSAALAHMGDSGHLHVPGDATTPTSSVWCVSFSQDPGTWRPDGETAVDASSMGSVSIIFKDCADILDDHYAIESYADGFERTVVGEPVIGMPDAADSEASVPSERQAPSMTVKAWTKHQKQWLSKGDKLAAQMGKVRTVEQARRALAAFQRHLKAETQWLRKNKRNFEPDSCLADDMSKWQTRVQQAQKSLNKALTAANRGNVAATTTNLRQFARAYTKINQVYNVGMCDF